MTKFFAIRMKTKYDYNICVHMYTGGTALIIVIHNMLILGE